MSTVTLTNDAAGALSAPQLSGGAGMEIWKLRMDCGLIIGGADALVSMLTGFSPLQEWVFKPLAGDWEALDKGATAWTNAGKAAQAMADDLDSFPRQVGDDWQGETSLAWANANGKIVADLRDMPGQFANMAAMCTALAEAAKQIAGLIADLLNKLSQDVMAAAVAAAVPVAGWFAEGGIAAKIGIEVTQGTTRIISAIEKFGQLVQKLVPLLQKLQKVAEAFDKVKDKLGAVVDVAGMVLDAAGSGAKATA